MNPIDELKQNLQQKRKKGQHVVSVDYVLRKLREADSLDDGFKLSRSL